MALYSISENAEEAYVVNSDSNKGCSIQVKCDTNKLNEKRDQSSFPDFYVNDNAELVIRGPKNILRTACEFAVENRDRVNVYVGSPVEISATLYNLSTKTKRLSQIFDNPDENTRIVDLIGYSSDVHDFKNYAKEIGIYLSKRTARRIMDGDIVSQISILERISEKGIQSKSSEIDEKSPVLDIFDIKKIHKVPRKTQSIKFEEGDKQILANALRNAFKTIADKYYLNQQIEPKVRTKNNKINISFDVLEED